MRIPDFLVGGQDRKSSAVAPERKETYVSADKGNFKTVFSQNA